MCLSRRATRLPARLSYSADQAAFTWGQTLWRYGGISVKTSKAFHDCFLIIDDKELYLIGASLKDLGKKCFGFTALDKSNILDILAKI